MSATTADVQADDHSLGANAIDPSGRHVAFASDATNLDSITLDTNAAPDVFVRDRDTDTDGWFSFEMKVDAEATNEL